MFETLYAARCRYLVPAFVALTILGCGHEAAPTHVRFADFDRGALKNYDGSHPLVIEFEPGERLPVNLDVSGEGFALDPQRPPLELVAKEHCFVRVGADGFRFSRDGVHFDKPRQPGSFRVGLWKRRDEHARLDVIIVGPRH